MLSSLFSLWSVKRAHAIRPNIFGIARTLLLSCICHSAVLSAVAAQPLTGIRVQGPGSSPEIGFACCDQGIEEMHSLFADQTVIASLNELHAEVAVAILDFAPERAAAQLESGRHSCRSVDHAGERGGVLPQCR